MYQSANTGCVHPASTETRRDHLLVSAARLPAQVGHGDERVLQSFTGGDSQVPVQMQQLFQEVHKSPPVLILSCVTFWINLSLETVG